MNHEETLGHIKFDRFEDPPRVSFFLPQSDRNHERSVLNEWMSYIRDVNFDILPKVDFDIVQSTIKNEHLQTKVLAFPSIREKGMISLYALQKADIDRVKRKLSEHFPPSDKRNFFRDQRHEANNRPNIPEKIVGSLKNDHLGMKLEFVINRRLKVKIYKMPITKLDVDVIVNAANEKLDNIGGIAKVIADAAGKILDSECKDKIKRRGKIANGDNRVTSAGNLGYQAIIHAVGPRWHDYEDKYLCLETVATTVTNILRKARKNGYKKVAMPPVSSGKALYCMLRTLCYTNGRAKDK